MPSLNNQISSQMRQASISEKSSNYDNKENLSINSDHPDYDPDAGKTDEERAAIDAALIKRLDWILIPWLCVLYLASFLDRANIGNAKIEGLEKDINITGTQYNIALSVFFISYSIFEPLSNILLKRMRPSIYIPIIVILWGTCTTLLGIVKNFSHLCAVRWFLGMTEAGLFPGVNYYLSCWYKRSEFGIRAAIFFSAAAISGSFGGLLAAAIAKMNGVGNLPGWAWIFILEGIATVLLGVASFWLVHDFPADASFLSADDKARVLNRLKADKQASAHSENFQMKYFYQSLTDWKTYAACVMYMGVDGALYAFAIFLPSIIKELGFTATKAQLLSVPPYILACLLTVLTGFCADRWKRRGIFNLTLPLFSIVGFALLLGQSRPAVSYFATFLCAMGIYPCISNTISWVSNNVEGVYKRGVTIGMFIGWGNLNGVMSSNVYRKEDAPRYRLGHAVVLGYLVVGLWGGSLINWWALRRENAKRERGERDSWVEGLSEAEKEDRGDMRPDFRYML